MRAKKPARRFAVSEASKAKAKDTRQQKLFDAMNVADEAELRLGSKAALMRRNKAAKAAKFSHAQDASEAQWNLLAGMLDTDRQSTVIRYVEFANQIHSGTGSLNKWEPRKIWLSRVYFIRAIDMLMKGYTEVTSATREMLAMEGYTDQAIDEALERLGPTSSLRSMR